MLRVALGAPDFLAAAEAAFGDAILLDTDFGFADFGITAFRITIFGADLELVF